MDLRIYALESVATGEFIGHLIEWHNGSVMWQLEDESVGRLPSLGSFRRVKPKWSFRLLIHYRGAARVNS